MSDVRELWLRSHGYKPDDIAWYARDLDWLLEDQRFQAPDFRPPKQVGAFFGLAQKMEAEVIRLMISGPPYEPRVDLDGAFGISQIHALFPSAWVDFFTRLGLPESAITTEMAKEWQPLFDKGVALRNGNLLSNRAWCVSDPAWSLLFPSYLALLLDPSIKAPFASDPAWITIDDAREITLAIVGDWGTGSWDDGESHLAPTDAIMRQIRRLDVDYTVHLGDVYPCGSERFYTFFLQGWKPGRRGSFTLNANHDMYAWARGYFESALRHPTFAAQQGTSHFAVELGDWIIVGLDTAYYDPSLLVSAGSLDPGQLDFLQRVRSRAGQGGKRIFVMTHHLAMNEEGTETTSLWDQVTGTNALGKAPDLWYWGHFHAAAVYSPDSAVGKTTKARVMGHGGLPFAAPDVFAENAGPGKPIECYARTPYEDDDPAHRGRAMNGFAVVTLTKDGGLRERFLNQDGSDMCP